MRLKKHTIPFAETKQFSKLFLDYIEGNAELRPFYAYTPEIASFKSAIEDRSKKSINRKVLVDVISAQYKGIAQQEGVSSNIQLLLNSNTYTVCTGHQLCLFTGPLYFIYKILTTINLAEALKKNYPENNFVPVYWMAGEDHDFDEIRSVNLFGKKINWEQNGGGPVGRLNTATLSAVIEELKLVLGASDNAKYLIQLFSDAYLNHTNLADATRYLVHQLFGEYGLVIIDADDARLKEEFMEIIKDDISNNTNFNIVNQSISALEKKDYKSQVNPREINIFRLSTGKRERIEQASSDTLNYRAEEYSPNVVLRPLYQQKILPNLAYIGGPGEIAYWLEYKAMFEHHNILFPVLIPRNFAMLSDEKASLQMQKLGLGIKDVFKETDALIKEYVTKNASSTLTLHEQEKELTLLYSELSEKVSTVDASLKASVEAEFQKSLSSLKNIEHKLLKSEKQKQEININQIKKLKEKFLPEGALQERYENFAPYYLKYGKAFISDLKETFDPFEFKLLVIEK